MMLWGGGLDETVRLSHDQMHRVSCCREGAAGVRGKLEVIDVAAVRERAKTQKALLNFSSEKLPQAKPCYVAWLDLMGSGHMMSVSMPKSANFLARLHMAVERAAIATHFQGDRLPINDGIYMVSESKPAIIAMVQATMVFMASLFVATPRPHDRFFVRGALAFGPVYRGADLLPGVGSKKLKSAPTFMHNVLFGPPIVQAYQTESAAPPYGIAIHESARSFAEAGQEPFRMTHWLWWQRHDENSPGNGVGFGDLKTVLQTGLSEHFDWMESSVIFHGLTVEKIRSWQTLCAQYFSLALAGPTRHKRNMEVKV